MAVVLGAIGRFLRGQRMGWLLILWCGRRIFYGILTPVQPYKGACRQVFASVPAASRSVKGCVNRWDRGRVWRGDPLAEWVVFESEPAGRFGETASRFCGVKGGTGGCAGLFGGAFPLAGQLAELCRGPLSGNLESRGWLLIHWCKGRIFYGNPHPGSAV